MNKINKLIVLGVLATTLGSCTSMKNEVGGWMGFNSDNYLPESERDAFFKKNYLAKGIKVPTIEYEVEKIPVSRSAVVTSWGFSEKPEVVRAYEEYVTGGKNFVVKGDAFITYPYDQYSRPELTCSYNNVCGIQLEVGEQMTSAPSLGDTERWTMDVMTTGTGDLASQLITLKPVSVKGTTDSMFSTNLVITTNKRVYNVIIQSDGFKHSSNTINFYYPFETSKNINSKLALIQKKSSSFGANINNNIATDVDFNTINPEDYRIENKGKTTPEWMPLVTFDDGHKTFIKMPSNTDAYQLPAVWIQRSDGTKELSSNDIFQKPYFILDGVYKKVFMFSGADIDGNKQEVEIVKK